jgi:hypothetical protein
MGLAANEGLLDGVTRTRDNSTPTTFREWCVSAFPRSRPSSS